MYLDNGISAAQSFSKCEKHSLLVKSDLFKSGFVPNKKKLSVGPYCSHLLAGYFLGFQEQLYVHTTGEDFRDP